MNASNLLRVLGGLLLANCALHLVTAGLAAPEDLKLPLAGFGLAFGALGLWTARGGRLAVLATLVVSALGLALGLNRYLSGGGPVALPVMFALDVVVLIVGGLWLARARAPL